jgi:hypothetical protein
MRPLDRQRPIYFADFAPYMVQDLPTWLGCSTEVRSELTLRNAGGGKLG